MNPVLRLLEDWSTHQDYFWFLALLAWGGVLGAEFRRREHAAESPARPWLLALAASFMLGALLELVLLAQDLQIPYLKLDTAMGAAQAAGTLALAWGATRRASARLLVSLVLAGLALTRIWFPIEAGLALCAAQALAVLALLRLRPAPISNLAAGWLILAPLAATHGPCAYAFEEGLRLVDWSHFSLPAAGASLAAGAALAMAAWRRRLQEVAPSPALQRDLRRALLALAAWLVAGVLLAIWYGRQARRAYEENLLSRVNMATLALDMNVVTEALGPELRVESVVLKHFPDGRPVNVAITPHTTAPVYSALRVQQQRLRKSNPDLRRLAIYAARQGRLLAFADDPAKAEPGARTIAREVSPADLERIATRASFLEGPIRQPWGAQFLAKAPLLHPVTGQVLGWLAAEADSTTWAVSFTQARLQTMMLVAVGVGLWALAVAYRLRREARDDAERKAASAAAADRLKSAFLAKVSHELRTPLQSLLGYSELLERATLGPKEREWMGALRAHGEVMLRLVNDLIDLGALQAGAFRLQTGRVNLPQIAQECIAALRPRAAAKGLDLALECAADIPGFVEGDAVRLKQILLNLTSNAVKYTERGFVQLMLARTFGGKVRFIVADSGPGIPEERRTELFRPFTRLTNQETAEGSGVGLALVAGLCAAMDGSVRVEERPGGGARFIVELPLPVLITLEERRGSASPHAALTGLKVVVADDNTLVRELLTVYLREQGAEVTVAADGVEAVAACTTAAPHVVVLDLAMPRLDGLGAARAIRKRVRPAPLLVGLSAHAQPDDEAAARAAGMDHFLVKPVRLATLAQVLSAARNGRPDSTPPEDAPPALVATLRAHYERETPQVLADMRGAFGAGDWATVRRRAHYLKNSADVLGAVELQDLCRQLLLMPDSATPPEIEPLLARIEACAELGQVVASTPGDGGHI